MIEANELRIGNYVQTKGGIVQIVSSITSSAINYNWHELHDLNPIELTADILIKSGFKKSGSYWFLSHVYVYEWGIIYKSYHTHSIMSEDDPRLNVLEFASLHQLQNYYFALTGKELEI